MALGEDHRGQLARRQEPSNELAPHGCTAVALTSGWMRSTDLDGSQPD